MDTRALGAAGYSKPLFVSVKHEGRLHLFQPLVKPVRSAYSSGEVVLITDRGVYKPGDTIHIKGWVREKRGGATTMPDLTRRSKDAPSVSARLGNGDELKKDVEIDAKFGSFNTTLVVPDDARWQSRLHGPMWL